METPGPDTFDSVCPCPHSPQLVKLAPHLHPAAQAKHLELACIPALVLQAALRPPSSLTWSLNDSTLNWLLCYILAPPPFSPYLPFYGHQRDGLGKKSLPSPPHPQGLPVPESAYNTWITTFRAGGCLMVLVSQLPLCLETGM